MQMPRPYRFSRHAMYVEIEKFFLEKPRTGTALFLGEGKASKIQKMFPPETKIISTDYPEVDIMDLPYEDNTYDYIVADQVLEHVKKPWIGAKEVHRVLKPGGFTILTSCLMMHIHAVPEDYWRFTPDGLKVLCEDFSKVNQCGGMGDFKLVKMCNNGYRGKAVTKESGLEELANANDGKNFMHVWIVAKK